MNQKIRFPIIICPKCRKKCVIHVNERHGEGEDHELRLISTHSLEAWAECEIHGWVSPRMDIRSWGPERPISEAFEENDQADAVTGLMKMMCE